MNPIIVTENLNFEYPAEEGMGNRRNLAAVENVNISIEKGSFVAVLGHNGSGKSTLAKLMSGVLTPTSGRVTVNGLDTADDKNLMNIKKTVGMVFQNPDNQLVATVVEEDVAFAPENLGLPPAEIRHRVKNALETVGMSDYAKQAPHRLSGGQKQRVAIAGIIAMLPECIIFDESTAMLDPTGRREIMDTIKKLNREKGITVILITHYMNEAVEADRVIVMNDAQVEMDGSPHEIFSQVERLWQIGLDVPQSTELIHMLKKYPQFAEIPDGLLDEDSAADAIIKVFRKENKLS